MKKNIIPVSVSVALALCALTSCDKENWTFGRTGIETISVGSVETSEPQTKAPSEETIEVALEDGSVFTIQKTIEPYTTEPQTKADIKDKGNLPPFKLYGYFNTSEIAQAEGASEEDKANTTGYFMDGATVIKGTDGKWHTEGNYFWRNGITHYFWAQSGADGMTTTASTASFTQNAESKDEDILVAYAEKKWNEHSGDDHSSDDLNIKFGHALSAATINTSITYKDSLGNSVTNRVTTDTLSIIRKCEGTCEVGKGETPSFTWKDIKTKKAKSITNGETSFSIPQSETTVQIYFTDHVRMVTKPVFISIPDTWATGHHYKYNIKGNVVVPTVSDGTPGQGINFNFEGKEKRSETIVKPVDVTHCKKMEISWEGLPHTSGKGTYAIVYYGKEPLSEKDLESIHPDPEKWLPTHTTVLFMFDDFNRIIVHQKGTVNGGESIKEEELTKAKCSCTMVIPDGVTGDMNIYIAYRGGAANQDTNWTLKNLNIAILEYK